MTELTTLRDDKNAIAEFKDLMAKTNKKNPSTADIEALRAFLKRHPRQWAIMGHLPKGAALQLIGGPDVSPFARESLTHDWHVLRDELGYQVAPPLERLLIEQVVLCWLRHNMLEFEHASAVNKGMSLTWGDFWDRRLAASQRRYLRACETLARIRKMMRSTPALQVNIAAAGGQQVNVARTT